MVSFLKENSKGFYSSKDVEEIYFPMLQNELVASGIGSSRDMPQEPNLWFQVSLKHKRRRNY
jgi:hypothetical protein